MGGANEPVSVRQVVWILVGLGACVVAGIWLAREGVSPRLPSLIDWLISISVVRLLVQPLATLLHELGHAFAVTRLGRRPALMIVGRGPWMSATCGNLRVRFSLVPGRGVRLRGACVYDPSGLSWRSIAWISLAGPIATGVTLAAVLAIAPALWAAGALARLIIFLTVIGLALSLIDNLIPRRLTPRADAAKLGERDGWKARQAFKCHAQGVAPPRTRPPRPNTASATSPAPPPPEIPAEERGALEAVLVTELERSERAHGAGSSPPTIPR